MPLSFLGIVETIYAQTTILASIIVGRREWGKYSAPLSLRRRTDALWEMVFEHVFRLYVSIYTQVIISLFHRFIYY